MRLGIDGLSARIQASLRRTPCDSTAYAFTNRRRSRLKLLVWDAAKGATSQRRLHRAPSPGRAKRRRGLRPHRAQWRWLIHAGVDWQRRDVPAPAHWRDLARIPSLKSMSNPPLRCLSRPRFTV
ncbi:MAG: IS66 family insertion sequence element accessory protein TnpB [Candidatus Accumulibacter sp.]|nr:IS66 family insertion sequence element accessory protein TnpB [Candidatus Accumulibacter propinquus]